VQKKNITLRICIDYQALNTVTIRDEYPLSCINVIFDQLAKAKYFSTLDLNIAYHQVMLDKDSRECTAFTCEDSHFQFKAMTFSFTNTPPTFQHMMINYLSNMVGHFIKVYLDDVLIHLETWKDHLRHIRLVLERLRKVSLYTKAKKCTWAKDSVKYLRHIISQGKLTADDEKVKAIQEWKWPVTGKELQCFLGLVNYYQEFIQDLRKIGRPLYEVREQKILEWTLDMETVFNKIRAMATDLPFWVLWDPTKNLRIRTNASEDGMGIVLE
jgi:Reverse transcriptase (RNA-dependent DNA polymerase)